MLSKGTDIVSIGEAMVELSCEGEMQRAATFQRQFGGDTLNTAVAARRLGSTVTYVTRLSGDPFGSALFEMMQKEGIQVANPRPARGSTGLYFVSVFPDGEREFYYCRKDSAASQLGPDDIHEELIRHSKIIYASGVTLALSESCRQAVLKAFRIAREAGVMTAFDPNYREALWKSVAKAVDAFSEVLPLVDVVLPSIPGDTNTVVGVGRPDQVIDYFQFKGVKLVVVKAGREGCYLGYKRELQHVPAMTVKAVDTTAAGDAFNGGFLHGLITGQSLVDCARLGNTTAGLKVINRGSASAMPNREAVYARF